jgi:hypothetical protein
MQRGQLCCCLALFACVQQDTDITASFVKTLRVLLQLHLASCMCTVTRYMRQLHAAALLAVEIIDKVLIQTQFALRCSTACKLRYCCCSCCCIPLDIRSWYMAVAISKQMARQHHHHHHHQQQQQCTHGSI